MRNLSRCVAGIAAITLFCTGQSFGASTQNIATSDTPTIVQAVNLTNDTNLDLLIGTGRVGQFNGGVQIAVGSASGVFGAAGSPATNKFNNPITSLAVGQLNNDARVDVVVGINNDTSIRVLFDYDTAGGDFQSSLDLTTNGGALNSQYVAVADLDGDGLQDIICANGFGINQSAVVTNSTNTVSVLRRTGNGTFAAAQQFGVPGPVAIAVGDINGDGKPDIITASAALNGVSILQNMSTSGAISFGTARTIAVGNNPQYLAISDINADGKQDLVVLIQGALNVLLGNGDGTFQNAISNPVLSGSRNFAIADMTTDGKLDLVLVTNIGSNVPSIFLLEGNGDGTFQAAAEFQVQGTATFAAVADFNKDNQPDVAATFGNFGSSTVTVRLLDPRPTITAITPDAALVQAANGAGVDITISGTNILSGSNVRFNGTILTPSSVTAPTSLTVTVPAGLLTLAGKADVTVTNTDASGSGIPSEPLGFTIYPTTIGTLTVTNTLDTGSGSLRFALQTARAGDTINFDTDVFALTNSDAATVINVLSELPELDDGSVTLDASNVRVTINGSGAGSACGLVVTSDSNNVRGLSIVGFARSGVCVRGGAASNIIGGNRAVGSGPNGQGLRISNCGAFGIEITGAGTDSNTVKGCWIGLDSSGSAAQANLAGILIQDGAKSNVIGSTIVTEGNAISGNSFEGVTVSGAGSDGNIVIGNIVGLAAVETLPASVASRELIPSRGAIGNGSAGVFLSRGTQNGRVGGDQSSEGNRVAHNGGNGVEVRSGNSQKNSAKFNRISRNIRGGIKLFDGSNNGINPPIISRVAVATGSASAASSRATFRARIQGSTDRDGTVEFFNDPADQGDIVLGRAAVVAGNFEVEIDIDDLLNLTATLTDGNGSTSAFSSSRGVAADSDGDGVLDALETLAGTNKDDPSSVPAVQGAVAADKIQIGLNFVTPEKDKLTATLRLIKPDNFNFPNATVGVLFGAHAESVTLDAKSKSPKGLVSVRVKTSKTGPGVLLSVGIKGTPLQSDLSSSGLQNRTTLGEVLKVFIATTLKDSTGTSFVYTGTVDVTYKASIGKAGKATKLK